MSNTIKIIQTLKRQLKIAGLTYRSLGARLGLSESAVKQMFASGNFSLRRLDEICAVINMDITELVEVTSESEARIEELGETLEQELVDDPKLLLVAYCAVNHWTTTDIVEHYAIEEAEIVRLLVKLDRMKLIELQPGNKIRLLITNSFKWIDNGPIETFFRTQVRDEFLQGDFQTGAAIQLIKNGDITRNGQRKIIERLEGIGALFDDICREDRKRPLSERKGTTMMLALRDWEFTAFTKYERT